MSLYKNKYRSESHRLFNWDYSKDSIYFITFCTQEREYLFGKIINGIIELNDFGRIIEKEIIKSSEIRRNMLFHTSVIMPNHVHFLIEIITDTDSNKYNSEIQNNNHPDTHVSAYLQRKPNSISSFVSGFKSTTAKQINMKRNTPFQRVWQNNYHDHVVRNEKSFFHIYEYIENNPLHWNEDLLK